MSAWDPDARRSDVVILTAIRLEFDAVLKVEAGAVPGSAWELATGPSGLPLAFRSFVVEHGRPLRVAVAVAPDMGATAATNTLLPLVEALKPQCIAMCGVCAGRPGKTNLGDVVAAERLFYTDTGKQLPNEIQQDLTTYKLRDDWKAALEGLDVVAQFRDAEWLQARPLTTEAREHRALVALHEGMPEPGKVIDPTLDAPTWGQIIDSLRARKWLAASGRDLTDEGRRVIDDLLFRNMGTLPDVSPAGAAHRFRLHVAPMGSGTRVIEDETIWAFISQAMRKTLGLEMEAAALGELAHRQRQYKLDALVMKGVMDFAQPGRDDHFKDFAARASAECLLWFLREHVTTEVTPGFDDLLTPGTLPLSSLSSSLSDDRPPSFLLNAKHVVVPWHEAGRSEILADLDAWADNASQTVAVRLLHGEGGIGKTRLAIEWVRRRRERYDVAGFLVRNPDNRWLERLCGFGPPVLVVIEYAESRADLVDVLERVAAFAAATGPRRQVRVLLLARGDGDWWAGLPRQSSDIGVLLAGSASIKLSPLAVTPAGRDAVFVEASKKFAEVRDRPAVLRPPILLDDARFGRVLYLHMAALAAVEGAAFDAGSLMDTILDHEEHFWVRKTTDRHVVVVDVPLARQLVAAATLRGGVATADEVCELCARLAKRKRSRKDDALIARLHHVYESTDQTKYLPGLEPDLLGEGMVLRVAAPPKGSGVAGGDTWIERVLVAGDDAGALTTAFTVLGRASATDPRATRPWIAKLLQSDLPARAVLALRAAKAVGQRTAFSALGDFLAEALEQIGTAGIAGELDREQIPHPTVSLQRVAAWRSQTLLAGVPRGDDEVAMVVRGARLQQGAHDFYGAGQYDAALAATREVVNLFRGLAKSYPDTFNPALAIGLNDLCVALRALGQRKEALDAVREATDLYHTLAKRSPHIFEPCLARSLDKLGICWREQGNLDAARAASGEAVDLYRTLEARDSPAFKPNLAGSLNNLGIVLAALNQHDAEFAIAREVTELYRGLALLKPDEFTPNLAMSLLNLSAGLNALGQHAASLLAAREATALYRRLAIANPLVFQPDLAMSLNNEGSILGALGRHELALVAAREGTGLYRMLAKQNPDAFQPDFAMSLRNLGIRLREVGQREEALAVMCETVDLGRTLATCNPDAFQPDFARSLNNLGKMMSELGQREATLATMREAVSLTRTLATRNPDAFQPDLAGSLSALGSMFGDSEQCEAAITTMREAVDVYRALAVRNADAFQPGLARSLNDLGIRLRGGGQREEALSAMCEAVDLGRMLAVRKADAFQPDLARSLNNLGNMLSELGQREGAVAIVREEVELYRTLAVRNAGVFHPDLAMSLKNLGIRLSEAGQCEAAVATTREAVDLWRTIAGRNADAFRPDLATSLTNLGIMLNELGQREAALASTREAVALFRTFAVHNTDAFQPHLAMSLEVLGSILIDAGECEVALAILREVMDLYRALATRNADAFQPDIVRSLNNLGRTLSDLGQYEEALEAMQEALDLIWPLFVQIPHVHVNLTGNILRTIRCLHGVLSREPSTEFVEREARFAEFAGTQT